MHLTRRTLMTSSLTLAASAPLLRAAPALSKAAPVIRTTPLNLVHPDLRPMMPQIEKYGAMQAPLTRAGLNQARVPNPLFSRKPSADVPWERRVVPVGNPHPDVAIYIINAKPGTSRPAILHTHGGGYVLGNAESAIYNLQEICKTLDCVAVSVDYRLAPETSYAGSIEDNYAGLIWLHANAASIGADPAKIAVMGESAGGGHAALLAITARDRGEVPVCFQCLIYPMLDDRTGTSRAVPPHVGIIIWNPEKNRFGWESFLGTKAGGLTAPKNAVPARVTNLKGLPPAFIGVGTLDLFVDEDIDYAQRLNAAGVLTELNVVPGAFHGFDGIGASLPVGKIFNAAKMNALRRGFGMAAV
jgi:acetyl esterase/lipase